MTQSKATLGPRRTYGKPFLRRLWVDLSRLGVQSKQVAALANVNEQHVCNVRAGRRTSAPVVEAAIALRDAARARVA